MFYISTEYPYIFAIDWKLGAVKLDLSHGRYGVDREAFLWYIDSVI